MESLRGQVEGLVTDATGSGRNSSFNVSPLLDAGGRPKCLLSIGRENTTSGDNNASSSIAESFLVQAIEQMPEGPVVASLRRISRPPKGDVYVHAENPRGEIGVYLVSDGSNKPYRVKVRPPSFCNLQALRHMLRGAYLADAVVILGSLDIILGEVDR